MTCCPNWGSLNGKCSQEGKCDTGLICVIGKDMRATCQVQSPNNTPAKPVDIPSAKPTVQSAPVDKELLKRQQEEAACKKERQANRAPACNNGTCAQGLTCQFISEKSCGGGFGPSFYSGCKPRVLEYTQTASGQAQKCGNQYGTCPNGESCKKVQTKACCGDGKFENICQKN
jgi:hypothetical protein